jgi:hypothetical protein
MPPIHLTIMSVENGFVVKQCLDYPFEDKLYICDYAHNLGSLVQTIVDAEKDKPASSASVSDIPF